jgi:Tetracyclin repressor-like, C-terminal domain
VLDLPHFLSELMRWATEDLQETCLCPLSEGVPSRKEEDSTPANYLFLGQKGGRPRRSNYADDFSPRLLRESTRPARASARDALRRHPWAIGLMDSRLNAGPATLRHHDAIIGCLRGAGFSIELAAHAISAIDSYLYGFTMQELSLPFSSPEETAEMAVTFLEQFPAEAFPHLAELTTQHVLQPGYDYGDEFEFGLDLILDGLEQGRARERKTR